MIRVQAHQAINQATINQSNKLDHVSPYAAPGWAGHPLDLHQSRCSEASSGPECRTVSSPNQTVSSPHCYIGTTLFDGVARSGQVLLLLPSATHLSRALSMKVAEDLDLLKGSRQGEARL